MHRIYEYNKISSVYSVKFGFVLYAVIAYYNNFQIVYLQKISNWQFFWTNTIEVCKKKIAILYQTLGVDHK